MQTHEKNELWNQDLNAYRPNHSTITALIDVMETWTMNIDRKQQNMTVFTDLSTAFDCVKHRVLIKKLKVYKTGPKTLKLSNLTSKTEANKLQLMESTVTGIPLLREYHRDLSLDLSFLTFILMKYQA